MKYELCPSYPDGFDLALNVKPELAEADFKRLQESFARVMSRFCHKWIAVHLLKFYKYAISPMFLPLADLRRRVQSILLKRSGSMDS